jgi:Zn-dependent metalloprotease
MRTVHDASGLGCPNASWNGLTTNYCPNVTSDDVVAHEWGHAYTQFTSGLVYAWQPGALNESYSDVWGETVDLVNGRGTDTPGAARAANGSACSSFGSFDSSFPQTDASRRWLMGEDSTGFGTPIRDMWNPECRFDPGRVGSSRYTCSSSDQGGVHTNSGVTNHLYALLVDGGTYNGETVAPLGVTKAASILWRALSVYETSVSDFADHADAVEQACADLIGAPLGEVVTTAPATWTTSSAVIARPIATPSPPP